MTIFCQPPEDGAAVHDAGSVREGFLSEEPLPASAEDLYSPKEEAANPSMFDQVAGGGQEQGNSQINRRNRDAAEFEARMKEAYDERERLELKVRSLEAQLKNQKKSTCSLL